MRGIETPVLDAVSQVMFDEAMLEYAEAENPGPLMRFWEAAEYAVVLGRGCDVEKDVHLDACMAKGIPVIRRASGGGTVLQGPGCLNYAMVLPIALHADLENVSGSNRYIMERMRDAFAPILSGVQIQGITDLTWEGRKFSGNAQRRKRHYLLFHGTVLYDFDLAQVQSTLKLPPRRPEYRDDRPHVDFIQNVPLARNQIESVIMDAWEVKPPLPDPAIQWFFDDVMNRYTVGGEWTLL
jgi:lipoate-protein ligase A